VSACDACGASFWGRDYALCPKCRATTVGDLRDEEVLALAEVVGHSGLAWTLADAQLDTARGLVERGLARSEGVHLEGEDMIRFWPTESAMRLWEAGGSARVEKLLARGDEL